MAPIIDKCRHNLDISDREIWKSLKNIFSYQPTDGQTDKVISRVARKKTFLILFCFIFTFFT